MKHSHILAITALSIFFAFIPTIAMEPVEKSRRRAHLDPTPLTSTQRKQRSNLASNKIETVDRIMFLEQKNPGIATRTRRVPETTEQLTEIQNHPTITFKQNRKISDSEEAISQ